MSDDYAKIPSPAELIAVLRWICPSCRENNPFDDAMNDQVAICLSCGELARPHQDLAATPLIPVEQATARRLLKW